VTSYVSCDIIIYNIITKLYSNYKTINSGMDDADQTYMYKSADGICLLIELFHVHDVNCFEWNCVD